MNAPAPDTSSAAPAARPAAGGSSLAALLGATGIGATAPAAIASFVFSTLVTAPLHESLHALVPLEVVRLGASFSELLRLTTPLTLAFAAVVFLGASGILKDWIARFVLGGVILLAGAWIGKTFALGLAADLTLPTSHVVLQADGSYLAQPDPTAIVTNVLAGNVVLRGVALLVNYYRLYGPSLFALALASGGLLGWYWARKLRVY